MDDVITLWDEDGNLVREADPSRETPERAEQERYKRALADRIAALLNG